MSEKRSVMGRIASGRSDIFKIDPGKLTVNADWNCRDFDDPDNLSHIATLKESIRAKGVLEPLTVRIEDGAPVVTNGECRLRAVRELIEEGVEIESVPVQTEYRHAKEADWIESQITRNAGKPFTPIETAKVFGRLKELGRTDAEIAAAAGVSAERVRQLLVLNQATEPTKDLVREGKVSATTVQRALEREKDPDKAEAAVRDASGKAEAEGKAKATPRHLKAKAPEPTDDTSEQDDNSDLLGDPEPPKPARRNFQELLAEVVSYAEGTDDDGNVVIRVGPNLWDRIKDVKA